MVVRLSEELDGVWLPFSRFWCKVNQHHRVGESWSIKFKLIIRFWACIDHALCCIVISVPVVAMFTVLTTWVTSLMLSVCHVDSLDGIVSHWCSMLSYHSILLVVDVMIHGAEVSWRNGFVLSIWAHDQGTDCSRISLSVLAKAHWITTFWCIRDELW